MRAWFCTNEAQLTDKAKAELEKEVADWNSCFKDRELVVSGYADTRGPTDYNTWLGGERAKTIADFLKSRGIKVAQLQPVGELDGLDDNQNCSNQRRVDIMFKGEEAEAPSRSCAPAIGLCRAGVRRGSRYFFRRSSLRPDQSLSTAATFTSTSLPGGRMTARMPSSVRSLK